MRDEETSSLWDHITGECFEGSLAGERLDFWPVVLTTVRAELTQHPDAILLKSAYRSFFSGFMKQMLTKILTGSDGFIGREKIFLAPQFRLSMHESIDPRRPETEQGLGVIDEEGRGKFYPMRSLPKGGVIEDEWNGRCLRIQRSALDGVPSACWVNSGEAPMQLLTRWYGFSFTYPACDIYET